MNNDLRRRLLNSPIKDLLAESRALRDAAWPDLATYSRKVFIPLTHLCRDVCHYCVFAKAPREITRAYMTPDEVLSLARDGAAAGCKEALFTLGDRPEARYSIARDTLQAFGFASTVDYLVDVAARVLRETGLLPHINAGVLDAAEYARLRPVAASMGLMLESTSDRLCERGGPHFGSPDKTPAVRLASIAAAGQASIPFTSGLLIGIGETRKERLDALGALARLHDRYGHLQEVIIQQFAPKPGTRMAAAQGPAPEELDWTLAAARLVLPPEVSVQAPPNLSPGRIAKLIAAGLNDWGGISPVTIDHVNPEAPWPHLDTLAAGCAAAGRPLVERLTAYPRFVNDSARWFHPTVAASVRAFSDASGLARDSHWSPGVAAAAPGRPGSPLGSGTAHTRTTGLDGLLGRALVGAELSEAEIGRLLTARSAAAHAVVQAADEARRAVNGEPVTYVVNRNINYTNICAYSCSFCAFSKTSSKAGARDRPYDLPLTEIAERVREARSKGATEVCLQGGIHPRYTGATYREILRTAKAAAPSIHVHAFSPLEIAQGARTLDMPVADYLHMLKDDGLGSLPGTAAEILDDPARAILCPDKLSTAEWLAVVRAAHDVGLKTTATIMFGSVETPIQQARHLLEIRRLQLDTGGFTEFVPLPFVHMRSPVFVKGFARKGPTWREAVLMHATARLCLHGAIGSIQASWVKLGLDGATACLDAGVNDLGGVLMNESISRAAGAAHGQELAVVDLVRAAASAGRPLVQRTTLYGAPAGAG